MQHHFHTLSSGTRLHFTAWGNPAAQAVVCVHGLTRNARDFDALAQVLANDYYAVCVDVLGRGESSWAKDVAEYSVANYAQQLLELINDLKLVKPHWVGTSMGGLIGLTLQLLSPNRLGSVVLNDVGPVIETVALQRIAHYIGGVPRFASRAEAMAYSKIILASFGATTDAQWVALTDYYYVNQADGSVQLHYDPLIATATKAQVAGLNAEALTAGQAALWASLKSFNQPVLVLRGADSDLLSPATVEQMLACNPQVSAVTIPDCGHAPHLLDEAQTHLIHSFLAQKN
jgi:pimeloyl-ACP methyl ester carboxylesterase